MKGLSIIGFASCLITFVLNFVMFLKGYDASWILLLLGWAGMLSLSAGNLVDYMKR